MYWVAGSARAGRTVRGGCTPALVKGILGTGQKGSVMSLNPPVPTAAEAAARPLLSPAEPGPVCVLDRPPAFPVLLVCDHASARIPMSLSTLGLPSERLADHIALDIGAAAVTRFVSERLGVPAVMTGYSRLVVDCNRRLDDPTAFPEYSDGVEIPGNAGLDTRARELRAEALYWPYHHEIRDRLSAMESIVPAPALIAIHSFTPRMNGRARPWHIGVLWDKDPRIPEPLMTNLRMLPDVCVGDNEPYSGRHPADFTIDHHAEAEGLAHVSIEIRQDLVITSDGVECWGERLADALIPILDDSGLYSHWPAAAARTA